MKKIFVLALLASCGAFANQQQEQGAQQFSDPIYDEITIDWDDKENSEQEYTSIQICDGDADVQKSGVDLFIPGQGEGLPGLVSYSECGIDWKVLSIDKTTIGKKKYTKIRIEGNSDCVMNIKRDYFDKAPAVLTVYPTC